MFNVVFRFVHVGADDWVLVVFHTPPSLPVKSTVPSLEKTMACESACRPSPPLVGVARPKVAAPSVETNSGTLRGFSAPPTNTTLAFFGCTAITLSNQHCAETTVVPLKSVHQSPS